MRCHGLFLLFVGVAAPLICQTTALVVVSSPGSVYRDHDVSVRDGPDIARSSNGVATNVRPIAVRIRATREEDIGPVSELLATAITPTPVTEQRNGIFNFGVSMVTQMKRSTSFHSLLLHRFQAIEEGKRALSIVAHQCIDTQVSDTDRLRLIWNHDAFRSKLQKAAAMSNEPHLWKEHNFSLCPQGASQLQHIMLTAEDTLSGSIVGFCEVAMMSSPEHPDTSNPLESAIGIPTIANLATSPQYRRRGIATSLLASATRYVQRNWETSSDEVALYVSKDNGRAVSLYKKHGFHERYGALDEDKLYMIMNADCGRRRR
jgi:ribosomal protein S18 acetylase RimI-like enzyme